MRHIGLKLLAAVLTFIIGISSAYIIWRTYQNPTIAPAGVALSNLSLWQVKSFPDTKHKETSIEEEWENLMKAKRCLNPEYYLLSDLPSVKRDKPKAVEFLISRIANTKRTHIHVDPYDMALEGEVAIYCLQEALDVPWYKLKEEYETQVKSILADHWEKYQSFLQGKIRNPRSARELMAAWKNYYETS